MLLRFDILFVSVFLFRTPLDDRGLSKLTLVIYTSSGQIEMNSYTSLSQKEGLQDMHTGVGLEQGKLKHGDSMPLPDMMVVLSASRTHRLGKRVHSLQFR